MKIFTLLHRLSLGAQASISISVLTLNAVLIGAHSGAVRDMRDIGLPAAVVLPQLQHRVNILSQQSEVAKVQSLLRSSTSDELLRMYVVPVGEDLTRTLATLDALQQLLVHNGSLQNSAPIIVDAQTDDHTLGDGFTVTPVHLSGDVTAEGLGSLLLFVRVSGMQTIADTLSENDQHQLLTLTEEENPAAIAALEQFLSGDLLRYVRDPKPFENELLRSFSDDNRAEQVRGILAQSQLGHVQSLLSGELGEHLVSAKVWPIRLMRMTDISTDQIDAAHVHVSLTLHVYGRTQKDVPAENVAK